MARKLFVVTGTFIIPGTREKAKFSGKVFAESRHHGSKDLATLLQEEFGWAGDDHADRSKRAPRGVKFSPDFALMHLQWKEHQPVATAPKVDAATIEAALIATGAIVSAPIDSTETV